MATTGGRDTFDVGNKLNVLELKLVRAIEGGGSVRFQPRDLAGNSAYIRAGLIRAILIGLPIRIPGAPGPRGGVGKEETRPVRLLASGVRIEPAKAPETEDQRRALKRLPIRGRLDLARLCAPGGDALPGFELTYCAFDSPIDLCESVLGSISLEGSRFERFVARSATISGKLNLRWCGPIEKPDQAVPQGAHFPFAGTIHASHRKLGKAHQGAPLLPADYPLATCTVNLHSAQIAGLLDLSFADFCRAKGQLDDDNGLPIAEAVTLASTNIRDMVVAEQTVILGGISLSGSEIGESVWFTGARLFGISPDHALNLQFATIGGLLGVRSATADRVTGEVKGRRDFLEPMLIGGAYALGLRAREIWIGEGYVTGGLIFSKCSIDMGVTIGKYPGGNRATLVNGSLVFSDAVIGKNLEFRDLRPLYGLEGRAFLRDNPFYANRLGQSWSEHLVTVFSPGIEVRGGITVEESELVAPLKGRVAPVIELSRARVSSEVRVEKSLIKGGLNLRSARVDGGIRVLGTSFDLRRFEDETSGIAPGASAAANDTAGKREDVVTAQERRTALSLRDCSCAGELEVKGLAWLSRTPLAAGDTLRRLSFYRDCALVEQRLEGRKFRRILLDLAGEQPALLLDGQSAALHEFNRSTGRLELDTPEKRRDYMTFFCDSIDGGDGSFKFVERLHDMPDVAWKPLHELKPKRGGRTSGPESWRLEGTVFYNDVLFSAEFELSDTGMIEMLDDTPVSQNLTLGAEDRFPDRTEWQVVNEHVEPRTFWGEEVAAPTVTRVNQDGEEVSEAAPARTIAARIMRWRRKPIDLMESNWAKSVAVVDLQGFRCGALFDEFGGGWGFPGQSQQVPRILLLASGIKCGRVQPSAHARRVGRGPAPNAHVMGELTAKAAFDKAKEGSSTPGDAAGHRIAWLSNQFSRRPASGSWPLERRWPRKGDRTAARWATGDDFIPQAYDEFATAHYIAGERAEGQKIVVEKKDIENSLSFRTSWSRLFPKEKVWRTVATAIVLVAGVLGLCWLSLFYQPPSFATGEDRFLKLLPGILVQLLSWGAILFVIWPALLWTAQAAFKYGFRYGLSPASALLTCALLLGLGGAGTHFARTGSFVGDPNWIEHMTKAGTLDEDIALVLSVEMEPAADTGATNVTPSEPSGLRQPGRAVYAMASPCDVGVSSLLYAADVFIPLLDLDQENRCTIRAAPDDDRVDRYRWWRLGKALYELIGWVVISLTILTLSGVMRRDIER